MDGDDGTPRRPVAGMKAFPGGEGAGVDDRIQFARDLARRNPGLPPGFAEAFAAQAVALRDMSEAELRQAVAARILAEWRRSGVEDATGFAAFVDRMGLHRQTGIQAPLAAAGAEQALPALAAALVFAGTPRSGMPAEVRDRYAAVLEGRGRLEPSWGLLQAWLAQGPARDHGSPVTED